MTRRLSLAVWISALLVVGSWWALSYRYGIGFAVSAPALSSSSAPRRHHPESGLAFISGVGKGILYLSWASTFTRRGIIFEPVLSHEFPHPWFGMQREGGRLWFSFPIGVIFALTVVGGTWHLQCLRENR